jgi:hypothetical protein
MLPSILKCLYSVEPVRMYFPAKQTCTNVTDGKMHSDEFNGIEILQGRWQHGEKVEYCYRSRLEKTLCKWDMYVPLVTKGLKRNRTHKRTSKNKNSVFKHFCSKVDSNSIALCGVTFSCLICTQKFN